MARAGSSFSVKGELLRSADTKAGKDVVPARAKGGRRYGVALSWTHPMQFPFHYSELRRAAHELENPEQLKALVLHLADQIEGTQLGEPCTYCALEGAIERRRSGLPCGPCVMLK